MRDLFEDVKKAVGCEYISDLLKDKDKVTETLGKMDMGIYPEEQVVAFRKYVEAG